MSWAHGKDTVILVGPSSGPAVDISEHCDTSELEQTADTHDRTGYRPPGKRSKKYGGGLLDAKLTMGGTYDSSETTGPRAVLKPLIGRDLTWTRRPEGTGTGLPQDTGNGILNSYKETAPVADYISWTAEIQCSDDIDGAPQAGA